VTATLFPFGAAEAPMFRPGGSCPAGQDAGVKDDAVTDTGLEQDPSAIGSAGSVVLPGVDLQGLSGHDRI